MYFLGFNGSLGLVPLPKKIPLYGLGWGGEVVEWVRYPLASLYRLMTTSFTIILYPTMVLYDDSPLYKVLPLSEISLIDQIDYV